MFNFVVYELAPEQFPMWHWEFGHLVVMGLWVLPIFATLILLAENQIERDVPSRLPVLFAGVGALAMDVKHWFFIANAWASGGGTWRYAGFDSIWVLVGIGAGYCTGAVLRWFVSDVCMLITAIRAKSR